MTIEKAMSAEPMLTSSNSVAHEVPRWTRRMALLGPLAIFLIFIALIAGFLLLLSCFSMKPLAPVFALITEACLGACEKVVNWSERLTWGHWYVGDGLPVATAVKVVLLVWAACRLAGESVKLGGTKTVSVATKLVTEPAMLETITA